MEWSPFDDISWTRWTQEKGQLCSHTQTKGNEHIFFCIQISVSFAFFPAPDRIHTMCVPVHVALYERGGCFLLLHRSEEANCPEMVEWAKYETLGSISLKRQYNVLQRKNTGKSLPENDDRIIMKYAKFNSTEKYRPKYKWQQWKKQSIHVLAYIIWPAWPYIFLHDAYWLSFFFARAVCRHSLWTFCFSRLLSGPLHSIRIFQFIANIKWNGNSLMLLSWIR